jgi:transposase
VRSGALKASAAARQLGVSRKTYYKWERRALQAMVEALESRPRGRPPCARDPRKEGLLEEVGRLRRRLLLAEQRLGIQESARPGAGGTKKKE